MEDLYAVMGVDADASPEEIRAAYRSLAQRFHPDHNPDNMAAARRMQEINEAFAVLNAPERRRAYDEVRNRPPPAPQQTPAHGAGRGQRPYYRGNNWGLHTGADEPPAHIVRAVPGSFNMTVTVAGDPPTREVTICNDAPFAVRMRLICSPWLEASAETIQVDGHGSVWLTVGITRAASEELRGWRDGGVSLVTDDPRVFCPDIRVTAIFMAQGPVTAPGVTRPPDAGAAGPDADLRAVNGEARRDGWLKRLFGG
jgi:hypothetical protein